MKSCLQEDPVCFFLFMINVSFLIDPIQCRYPKVIQTPVQNQHGPLAIRAVESGDFVDAKIESGSIRGRISNVLDRPVVTYFGVPYAKAPVGNGRFTAAQGPPEPWSGIKEALEHGADCYSIRDNTFPGFPGSEMWNGKSKFSEDCLNLNIWAPYKAKNRTVMIWIFGGGFFSGSPSLDLYDGGVMAALEDVIVVAINYRLGPFGFLNLDDDTTNIGLLDQQTALAWVNRNIHIFGGDPNRVTIFGESAGAASVSSHLLAPGSWPYFRYAILQSGAFTLPWATVTPDRARRNANQLFDILNCPNGTDRDRLQCARGKNVQEVSEAYQRMVDMADMLEFQFCPRSIDSTFYRGDARQNLKENKFKKTALIMGTVADEGTYWLPYYLPQYFNNYSDGLINRKEYWYGVEKVFADYYFHPSVVRKAIGYHYLSSSGENDPSKSPKQALFRDSISKMLHDFFFSCRSLDFADIMMKGGSVVYTYFFNERSSANAWPEWMGVMHGYEIEYMFGVPVRQPELYTPEEVEFSRRVLHYWTSFAKHGEPQSYHHYQSNVPLWPIYGQKREFLILQSKRTPAPPSWIDHRVDDDDCGFWKETERICQDWEEHEGYSGPKTNAGTCHMTGEICILMIHVFSVLWYILMNRYEYY